MNGGALDQALATYTGFHWGEEPCGVVEVSPSPHPPTLVKLGELREVTYRATKGGSLHDWQHAFTGRRPVLAMDPSNKRLHVVGGSYTVNNRGIVG